ncbi:MAG TPA: o-succinylbenzoate synthase [Kiritimatiellia bacterium]
MCATDGAGHEGWGDIVQGWADRFGVETAQAALEADARGVPMYRLWKNDVVRRVRIAALLIGSTDEVVRDARVLRAAGFASVKLKVGGLSIRQDIDRVFRVREALGPDVLLRLDANRAWEYSVAMAFGTATRDAGIEFYEEPVKRPQDIAQFHGATGLPVALDETLRDTSAEDWQKLPGVACLVIKPSLVGGIDRTLELADIGRKNCLKVVISSAYESGVGWMALAHLAAAVGGEDTAAGLGTRRWMQGDVLNPAPPIDAPEVDPASLSTRNYPVDRGRLLDT